MNPIKPMTCAGIFLLLLHCLPIKAQELPQSSQPGKSSSGQLNIPLQPGEKIWPGFIRDGEHFPCSNGYRWDFYGNNRGNQMQPLLLGSHGLWVWSDEPYAFEVAANKLIITSARGEVKYGRVGDSLADARKFVSDKYFPASGRTPDELLFARPQYNTWIELTYNQNQADVLKYARGILDNGLPEPHGFSLCRHVWGQRDAAGANFLQFSLRRLQCHALRLEQHGELSLL